MDARQPSQGASKAEREHLELAHHDLCTALTVLCTNVELVRHGLKEPHLAGVAVAVHAHLDEVDGALARLRVVAHDMKRWHDAA